MNDDYNSEDYKLLKEIITPKDISLKTCTKCKKTYPATTDYFHKHKKRKDGFDPWCKQCKKEYAQKSYLKKILSNYNISKEDYDLLLKKQNYKCAICGLILKGGKHTHIDHDHKTNEFRSVLCNSCNGLIGFAFENPFILANSINYLKKYKRESFKI